MRFTTVLVCALAAVLFTQPVLAKKDKEKHKQLPPGLQKNADRGKPLPPGWAKKLKKGETLDEEVYEHSDVVVPVDDKGMLVVKVEGKVIKLIKNTREIVEILDQM